MFYLSFLMLLLFSLTYYVNTQSSFVINIDKRLLTFFHTFQGKTTDMFFSIVTWLGSLWILFPLYLVLILYLFNNGYKNLVYGVSIGFLGSILTTYSMKYILKRERPEIYYTIGDLPLDPSFPSAHTTQIFIAAFLSSFLVLELKVASGIVIIGFLFLIAILVASSRIYLQVHYFSDVLAGVIVASIWIYAAIYITRLTGEL